MLKGPSIMVCSVPVASAMSSDFVAGCDPQGSLKPCNSFNKERIRKGHVRPLAAACTTGLFLRGKWLLILRITSGLLALCYPIFVGPYIIGSECLEAKPDSYYSTTMYVSHEKLVRSTPYIWPT